MGKNISIKLKEVSIKLTINDDSISYVILEDEDTVIITSHYDIQPDNAIVNIILDNIKRDILYTLNI